MKSLYSLLLLALGLTFLAISIIFNPYALQSIDRLLLFAPNCPTNQKIPEKYNFWKISDAIVWSLMKFAWFYAGKENRCNACALYKQSRCHARFDSVQVNSINWWDRASFQNVSVKSDCNCVAKLNTGTNDTFSAWRLLPFYLFQRNPVIIRLVSLVDVSDKVQVALPAMEIKELAMNWHDISRPLFDINLSNVTVNLVFQTEPWPLARLEVPVPFMRVGGWSIKEILDMIPPPPDQEGTYPRLGVFNISDVTFLSHGRYEDSEGDDHKITIPNEVFLPLYLLTKQAGPVGVDRTNIEELMKDAVGLAIRKYVLGEGEDTILETLRKTSTFIETFGNSFEVFINEGGDTIDHQLSDIMNAVADLVEKLEDEWNGTVNEQRTTIGKFVEELKGGWDAFKHPDIGQAWDEMKEGVQKGVKAATDQLQLFERALERLEQRLGHKWQDATNDAKMEVQQIWHNFVKERSEGKKWFQNEL
jgi:hypothetical protein